MEKTHIVKIDIVRVDDKTWNAVARWTQRRVFNSIVNFMMDGFKIPRTKKDADDHQVIGLPGDEKYCQDAYNRIVNVEATRLQDIAQSLKKVLPKKLRHKLMAANLSEEKQVWTRVTTMLGMMGIHVSVAIDPYSIDI